VRITGNVPISLRFFHAAAKQLRSTAFIRSAARSRPQPPGPACAGNRSELRCPALRIKPYSLCGAPHNAEYERELVRERTKAGLEAARARGRLLGRPRKLTREQKKEIIAMVS